MKTTLLGVLMVLSMIFSGCATTGTSRTRAPKVPKAPSPEKVAKVNAQWEEDQHRYKIALGLECPVGGYETVEIHNRLGSEAKYLGVGNAAKFTFRRNIVVLRAHNTESGVVHIADTQGVVVRDMCPMGTITLAKTLLPLVVGGMDVFWIATGINSRGELGQSQSQRAMLWSQNWWQFRQDGIWNIQLQSQSGGFFSSTR